MKNLKSSVNIQGKTVTQIIHFVGGVKRTYHGILTESIKQGQFTKMVCEDGTMIMINDENVLCIEIFKEDKQNKNNGNKTKDVASVATKRRSK